MEAPQTMSTTPLWLNCSARKCDYWIHAFCVGLVVKDENVANFEKLVKYYCPPDNPKHLPRGGQVLKKKITFANRINVKKKKN